jgi:hypothetical protein
MIERFWSITPSVSNGSYGSGSATLKKTNYIVIPYIRPLFFPFLVPYNENCVFLDLRVSLPKLSVAGIRTKCLPWGEYQSLSPPAIRYPVSLSLSVAPLSTCLPISVGMPLRKQDDPVSIPYCRYLVTINDLYSVALSYSAGSLKTKY